MGPRGIGLKFICIIFAVLVAILRNNLAAGQDDHVTCCDNATAIGCKGCKDGLLTCEGISDIPTCKSDPGTGLNILDGKFAEIPRNSFTDFSDTIFITMHGDTDPTVESYVFENHDRVKTASFYMSLEASAKTGTLTKVFGPGLTNLEQGGAGSNDPVGGTIPGCLLRNVPTMRIINLRGTRLGKGLFANADMNTTAVIEGVKVYSSSMFDEVFKDAKFVELVVNVTEVKFCCGFRDAFLEAFPGNSHIPADCLPDKNPKCVAAEAAAAGKGCEQGPSQGGSSSSSSLQLLSSKSTRLGTELAALPFN